MLIWNSSYAETYAKYMNKIGVQYPVTFKSRLNQYDKEKQAYNEKHKARIKEVKMNKRLNTKRMTDTDNNRLATYVPYNKRRRIDIDPNIRLDRVQTPRIPKKITLT